MAVFNIAIVVDSATAVLIILILVAELVLVVAVGFVVVLMCHLLTLLVVSCYSNCKIAVVMVDLL